MNTVDIQFQYRRLLKAAEVAEYLNISRAMAYRLIQTRKLRSVKIGGALRVRPVDLAEFVEDNLISEISEE